MGGWRLTDGVITWFASCVGTVGERRMQEESRSGRWENIRASSSALIHLLISVSELFKFTFTAFHFWLLSSSWEQRQIHCRRFLYYQLNTDCYPINDGENSRYGSYKVQQQLTSLGCIVLFLNTPFLHYMAFSFFIGNHVFPSASFQKLYTHISIPALVQRILKLFLQIRVYLKVEEWTPVPVVRWNVSLTLSRIVKSYELAWMCG